MHTVAVTGGIATGKSLFCELICSAEPRTVVFDADAAVGRLFADAAVRGEIRAAFGPQSLGPDGGPDRRFLRERVFANPAERRRLEEILHPRVRRECLATRQRAAKSTSSPLFLADIPLFYESGGDFGQEMVVAVAATPFTQAQRLRRRNGFRESLIQAVLAAQLPIAEKIRRADVVVWNNGSREVLQRQTARILSRLIPE
jgi:dephospho-CoA kinase